ncbi:MAG: heavy metal-binding domain-containing protein [Chthoniobacteraceae bacterium]
MKPHFQILMVALLLLGLGACTKPPVKAESNIDYYTCTMHPSVHSKVPGKCPICGMDLVPVFKKGAAQPAAAAPETSEFSVPVERQQQIGVTYATVEARRLQRDIRTAGFIAGDARRSWAYIARVDGYVQQLLVASSGGDGGRAPRCSRSTAPVCWPRSGNSWP